MHLLMAACRSVLRCLVLIDDLPVEEVHGPLGMISVPGIVGDDANGGAFPVQLV